MRHFARAVFLIAALALLGLAPLASRADAPYRLPENSADSYYGHISLTDIRNDGLDPVVIRAGKNVPEPAVLNFPIVPGDTILTTAGRRCEIQFDTGTIVRLDLGTELKVETILAQSLTSLERATNLVLAKGRVFVMFRDYDSRELFQVMTGNAAVKLGRDAVVMIAALEAGPTDVQVKLGKATVLYGPSSSSTKTAKVGKLERLVVSADHRAETPAYAVDSDFEKWNEEVNANFVALHRGQSVLPKPIMHFSPAVTYFAQKYSNIYGEWLWDDLYGYVWRPFVNDAYPWGNWRPYVYGQWSQAEGRLFWIPEESWGWVPYHLGVWTWNKAHGWLWIPGSIFYPAWVDWGFFGGSYYWRPWSFFDWWTYDMDELDSFLIGSPFGYPGGMNTNPGNEAWGSVPPPTGKRPIYTSVSKGQLAPPHAALLPVPKELKSLVKNSLKAFLRNDARVHDALRAAGQSRAFVRPDLIGSARIDRVAVGLADVDPSPSASTFRDRFFESARATDPVRQSAFDFDRGQDARPPRAVPLAPRPASLAPVLGPAVPSEKVGAMPPGATSREARAAGPSPAMRFRDWNPDIREALRQGVTIVYASRTNEISCPQLHLSSHDVTAAIHSSGGMAVASGSGFVGASGAATGHNDSSSSSAHGGSSAGAASHSGGGTVKKD